MLFLLFSTYQNSLSMFSFRNISENVIDNVFLNKDMVCIKKNEVIKYNVVKYDNIECLQESIERYFLRIEQCRYLLKSNSKNA